MYCYAKSPTAQDANIKPHQLQWGDWEMGTVLCHAQNAVG